MPEAPHVLVSEGLVFNVHNLEEVLAQSKLAEVSIFDQANPLGEVTRGLGRLSIATAPARTEQGGPAIGIHGRIELRESLTGQQQKSFFDPLSHKNFAASSRHNRSLDIENVHNTRNAVRIRHVIGSTLLLSLDTDGKIFSLTNSDPEADLWPQYNGDDSAGFRSFIDGYTHTLNYITGLLERAPNPAQYSLRGSFRLAPKVRGRNTVPRQSQIPGQRRPVEVARGNDLIEVIPPDASGVRFEDVCGLEKQKQDLRIIAQSFKHPEIMARWDATRPTGILLYGPEGTGKTMLVQALANEIGAVTQQIRPSNIYQPYIGQSEADMQKIFDEAREYTDGPLILFFDEIDAIIAITNDNDESSGGVVRNNVAGIFKRETNTLAEANPNVLIAGTTNRIDSIHPSLVRPGRFMKLAVPAPDERGRKQILDGILVDEMSRRLSEFDNFEGSEVSGFQRFGADINTASLARLMEGYTGADITEVFRRLKLMKAMEEAERGEPASPISQKEVLDAILTQNRAA